MFLRIEETKPKKLIGYSTTTSIAEDKTIMVWKKLMPRLKEIHNAVSADLFSLQIYDFKSLEKFTPLTKFQKYALVEVKDFDSIPEGFEKFELEPGKYAVFLHKGTTQDFMQTTQFIFGEWLPKSEFKLDDRPHFELLGDKYKGHENPESEEEVWIPVK
ncbi:GyrI-like domain-containing protein [Flavobacterium okayamense]|uniref:AraC effector-binding domain-containing protein n=1 Tax=Flavobacterium okayamense TaxID=2830782 RepID=A0ABM7SB98_9FLAO|nr:GyrI-like domain-containing protein [Flavobacterium okayamense]BCY28574.1 hypothetical protein KK2020170_14420 [Flavobacterium okayamense]